VAYRLGAIIGHDNAHVHDYSWHHAGGGNI
jgi:hypothetical protein